jgi:hypothetical protein
MGSDDGGGENRGSRRAKRHEHRPEHQSWPVPASVKGTASTRSGKTMHHPATRIAEIKHGKRS